MKPKRYSLKLIIKQLFLIDEEHNVWKKKKIGLHETL